MKTRIKGHDISVTSERLMQFKSCYVSEDSDLSSRMSELVWFDMYVLDQEFGVSSYDILESINNLARAV